MKDLAQMKHRWLLIGAASTPTVGQVWEISEHFYSPRTHPASSLPAPGHGFGIYSRFSWGRSVSGLSWWERAGFQCFHWLVENMGKKPGILCGPTTSGGPPLPPSSPPKPALPQLRTCEEIMMSERWASTFVASLHGKNFKPKWQSILLGKSMHRNFTTDIHYTPSSRTAILSGKQYFQDMSKYTVSVFMWLQLWTIASNPLLID